MTLRAWPLGAAFLAVVFFSHALSAQDAPTTPPPLPGGDPVIFVIPIHDNGAHVDWWQANYIQRKIEAARRAGAQQIIFDIDTNGGRGDAMLEMGDIIRRVRTGPSPVPTVAYVRKALSAGTYIAMSCDYIYMQRSATMGAATPIIPTMDGGAEAVTEKALSYFRKQFQTHAFNHPRHKAYWPLWVAMVDPDIVVWQVSYDENGRTRTVFVTGEDYENKKDELTQKPGFNRQKVVSEGRLLTVTAPEGVQYGMVDGIVNDRQALVTQLTPTGTQPQVVAARTSWGARLSRFLSGPLPSGLLLSAAIVALLLEFKGVGGLGAISSAFFFALFFYCKFVAGTAGGLEILIFFGGVALLAVEVFAIPGFGLPGLLGIGMMIFSLFLSSIPDAYWDFDFTVPGRVELMRNAFLQVVLALGLGLAVLLTLVRYMEFVPFFNRLVLAETVEATSSGTTDVRATDILVGKVATAATDLRPAGKIELDDRMLDVVCQSGYVPKGERVRIIEAGPGRVVVEPEGQEADQPS